LHVVLTNLVPSICDVFNVSTRDLSFLKLEKGFNTLKLMGNNHILMIFDDLHEVAMVKNTMDFVYILVPTTYVLPL
jgi:hypothetical protein